MHIEIYILYLLYSDISYDIVLVYSNVHIPMCPEGGRSCNKGEGHFCRFSTLPHMRHDALGHGAERGAAPEGARESVVHVLSLWRDKAHTWRSKGMYEIYQLNF